MNTKPESNIKIDNYTKMKKKTCTQCVAVREHSNLLYKLSRKRYT